MAALFDAEREWLEVVAGIAAEAVINDLNRDLQYSILGSERFKQLQEALTLLGYKTNREEH